MQAILVVKFWDCFSTHSTREGQQFISVISVCCRMSLQVNESVLRPASMEPLSDLQLAEELIKQEMITMLHHDCLHHPTNNAASQLQRGKNRGPTSTSNNASHIAYLETHSYKPLSPEEMEQVKTKQDSIGLFYRKNIYRYI